MVKPFLVEHMNMKEYNSTRINKEKLKRYSYQAFQLAIEVLAERSKEDDQILEDQKLKDTIKQAIREVESEKEIEE